MPITLGGTTKEEGGISLGGTLRGTLGSSASPSSKSLQTSQGLYDFAVQQGHQVAADRVMTQNEGEDPKKSFQVDLFLMFLMFLTP